MSIPYKDIKNKFAKGARGSEALQDIRFHSCSEARDQIVAMMQFKLNDSCHRVVLTQADLCDFQEYIQDMGGLYQDNYRRELDLAQNEMISHMKFRRG